MGAGRSWKALQHQSSSSSGRNMAGKAAVSTDLPPSAPKGAVESSEGTYEPFAGMIKFGLSRCLCRIATLTDLGMEHIPRRAGRPLPRIGEPHTIGSTRAS